MTASIAFGRSDSAGPDTVTPVGTAQIGSAVLTGGLNFCPASAGVTAVRLPLNAAAGSPITVVNTAGTATALLVFPPLNNAGAAAGGKVYGTATSPAADASTSIAQGKSATFWPHPNGIDFSVVLGA
jgi:hypothetical protein